MTDERVDYLTPIKHQLTRLLSEIRSMDDKRAEAERLASALELLGETAPELPWRKGRAPKAPAVRAVEHTSWTPEEDAIIVEQAMLGRTSSEIARLLPGRRSQSIGIRMAQLRKSGHLRDGMDDPVPADEAA